MHVNKGARGRNFELLLRDALLRNKPINRDSLSYLQIRYIKKRIVPSKPTGLDRNRQEY